jgi:hypothetical protein
MARDLVVHLVVIIVVAVGYVRGADRFPHGSRAGYLLLGAVAGLPLLTLGLSPATRAYVVGTEGLVEAVTEGLLAGVALRAGRRRYWGMALGALLLFVEEINYGFLFVPGGGPATPSWLASRSGQFNFHNTPYLDWLWKPLPLLLFFVWSHPRVPRWLSAVRDRLGVPPLDPSWRWGLLTAFGLLAVVHRAVGPRAANEAAELAFVAVLAFAWPVASPPEPAGLDEGSAPRDVAERK